MRRATTRAQPRILLRFTGPGRTLALAAAGVAAGALLVSCAALEGTPLFTDLRTIEPIHGSASAGAQKSTVCASCHGADGVPVAPIFPRLAGQRADYLYHRLASFHHADPKDPYYSASPMTALAAGLSDEDMRDLATYFASQPPHALEPPPPSASASMDHGERLYAQGDPEHGIPPCQGCHGADAKGPPLSATYLAAYPALRGQNAPYLSARLTNYRNAKPADTSNTRIMHGVAETLDDGAIQDISAWLSSLSPTPSP